MNRYRNGLCGVCGIRRMVCRDGMIGHHYVPGRRPATCPGARKPPAAGTIIQNERPFDAPARPRPRGICPDCHREAVVTTSGVMAMHPWYRGAERMGWCLGSGSARPLPQGV